MTKIVHTSRILKYAALSLCIALPILEAGYWITHGYPFLAPFFQFTPLPHYNAIAPTFANLTAAQTFLCFLINLIPVAFSMAALLYLAQIFGAFQRMQLFDALNAVRLKRAGWALVWGQLVEPVHEALLSLALTYNNAPGERLISVGFGSHQLTLLTIGLAVLLLSWILAEAAKMHEEQAATI